MERVAGIAELTQALAEGSNEEELYTTVVRYLTRLIPSERVSIALCHQSRDEYHLISEHDLLAGSATRKAKPMADTAIQRAVSGRTLVFIPNLDRTNLVDAVELRKHGMRTLMSAPVAIGNSVAGTLNVANSRLKVWHTEDKLVLTQVGSLLGLALGSRQLSARFENEIDILAEVGRRLNSADSEDELFDRLTEAFPHLVPFADRVSVVTPLEYKIDRLCDWGRVRVVFGHQELQRTGSLYLLSGSPLAECMTERRVISVPEIDACAYPHMSFLTQMSLRSLMAAPIVSGSEAYGSLNFASRQPNAFGEREQRFLSHLAGYLGVAIAALRRRQKLEDALLHAREASKAKGAFLAMMSHEIRTPLNGVLAIAELLTTSELSDGQREYVQMILDSGDTLRTILNDVLDFSKIEAGRLEVESVPVNLAKIIEETTRWFRGQAKEKALSLNIDVESLPDWVLSDPTRFRQVLSNLVSNGLKFTSEGSVTVKARTESLSPNSTLLHLSVTDTGIGIEHSRIRQIFEPFLQADSSMARRYGGTGLGLSITRRLIELMGGAIEVSSKPGAGSIFSVRLPLAHCGPPQERSADTNDKACLAGLRVLVAEDNPVNQLVARRVLEKLGVEVSLADSGRSAIDQARTHQPDIILMDVQMPVMDGLEATRQLRLLGFQGPIIALTANAGKDSETACLGAGMNDFLAKPFTRIDVERVLTTHAASVPVVAH